MDAMPHCFRNCGIDKHRAFLARKRKIMENSLQYCAASEIAADQKAESLKERRKAQLSASRTLQRSYYEQNLASFAAKEQQLEAGGVFSLTSPSSLVCEPHSSKFAAYEAMKSRSSDSMMVYCPRKDIVSIVSFQDGFSSRSSRNSSSSSSSSRSSSSGSSFGGILWSIESIGVWPVFTLPVAVIAKRLSIPFSQQCEACGLEGKGSKHLYGGMCSKPITTF